MILTISLVRALRQGLTLFIPLMRPRVMRCPQGPAALIHQQGTAPHLRLLVRTMRDLV